MSLAVTVLKSQKDLRSKKIKVKVVASGNYAPGGDTLNLQGATNPNFLTDATFGYPGTIDFYAVDQTPDGYTANLIPGSTLANWKLQIFSAANTELAAGAYPAGISGGSFELEFEGPKGQL